MGGSGSGCGSINCEFLDYTKHGSNWQLCSKDLPVKMMGPRITTTAKGDDLITTFEKSIYRFYCVSSNSCFFVNDGNELKISRRQHLLLTVPAALVEDC